VTAEESVSDEKQQTSSSDPLENLHLSAEEWQVIRNLLKRGAYHLIDEQPLLFIYRTDTLIELVNLLAKFSVYIDGEVNSLGSEDSQGSDVPSRDDDEARLEHL
jgi:hypothetical protein